MSVDTHLKGKDLSPYRRLSHDDLTILVSPKLISYANGVQLYQKGFGPFRKIAVAVDHEHGPHCNHG